MRLPLQPFSLLLILCFASTLNLHAQSRWHYKTSSVTFTENGVSRTTLIRDSIRPRTSQQTQDDCPSNIDFELGSFANWQCYTGTASVVGSGASAVNTMSNIVLSGPQVSRHTIISASTTPAMDPYGNFPVLCPNGSGYSVKLGNNSSSSQAERIRYTFTVPITATDFNLLYQYAVVFQNPQSNHTAAQQPRFQAKVYDAVSGAGLACANYDFIATAGLPGFGVSTCNTCNPASNASNPVLYKTWTPVTINLSGFAGRSVILEFTTEDCTLGGHFGYAYIDVNAGCSGLISGASYCQGSNSVTLNAPSGYQTYNWYNSDYTQLLGTGPSITLSPPPALNSVINIDLIPYPGFGCRDTVYTTVTVHPKPTAAFTVDAGPVCISNSPAFQNTTTSTGGTNTYLWSFGDNTSSTNTSPTHIYNAAGTYDVKLLVNSGAFCKDSTTKQVTIVNKPGASFDITGANQQCVLGNNYTFQNTSPAYNSPVTYTWYTGDGNTSAQHPLNYQYTSTGTYNVKLLAVANNVANCKDSAIKTVKIEPSPAVAFGFYNGNRQCFKNNVFKFKNNSTSNVPLTYEWFFGDGGSSTSAEPQYSFAAPGVYQVKLIASATGMCKDSVTIAVTVDPDPVADFAILSLTGQCVGANQFTFQNNSSAAGALSYNWNFGDGNSSTQADASYVYTTAGNFNVRLIAKSTTGCADTISKAVSVFPKPSAAITVVSPAAQCLKGNNFSFQNATTSTDNYTHVWTYGNNQTATSPSINYVYATPGTFDVSLVATSDRGCIDSVRKAVTVNPSPVAAFTVDDSTQCFRGHQFAFADQTTITSGTWNNAWDFGDGSTATQSSPLQVYAAYNSTYLATMVVTSEKGCQDTATKKVFLYQHPVAAFNVIGNTGQCEKNNNFGFANTSTFGSAMTYQWSFADGSNSTSTNTNRSFTSAGDYQVMLVASSVENGCTDTVRHTVQVFANPGAVFTVNATPQCLTGNNYFFDAAATGTNLQYHWTFGDAGTAGTKSVAHSYVTAGSYNVRLIVDHQASASLTCSDTSAQQVVILPMPTGTIINKGTYDLCQGDSKLLQANGGNTYQWFLNGQPVNAATNASYGATTEGVYTVKVINQYGCSAIANDTVYVNEIKQPAANFTWDSYCINRPVNFTNTSLPGAHNNVSYAWSFGDNTAPSASTNPQHTFNAAAPFDVKLTVRSTLCTNHIAVMNKTVNIVNPLPGVRYPSINGVAGNIYILNARTIGTKYRWMPATDLTNPNSRTPTLKATGEQEYRIAITTPSGCETVDSLHILSFAESQILVPKAFTPNRDGMNDMLFPILVGIRQLKFFNVYNRWGNLVFTTSTALTGWDGTYRGQLQPSETYTWVAEAIDEKGRTIRNGGNTILIR